MKVCLLSFLCLFVTISQAQSLKIISNGNVGIGTSSPTLKLDVAGQVKHTGLRSTADKRLKKDIKPLREGLREVLKMTPVVFNYNGKAGISTSYRQIGLLAQEVQKLVPAMISEETYYEKKAGSEKAVREEYLSMQSDAIQYVLINAIKEQNALLFDQEELLNEQAERIDALEARLDRLTSLIEGEADAVDGLQEIDVVLKGAYRLGQNEPNPFGSTTQIPYMIPSGSKHARIEFYSLNGALLKSVPIVGGEGVVNLSQQDLPSGQYTYRLVVNGVTIDSKKMSLMR